MVSLRSGKQSSTTSCDCEPKFTSKAKKAKKRKCATSVDMESKKPKTGADGVSSGQNGKRDHSAEKSTPQGLGESKP